MFSFSQKKNPEFLKTADKDDNSKIVLYLSSVPNTLQRSVKQCIYDKKKHNDPSIIYKLVNLYTKAKPVNAEEVLRQADPFFDEIILLSIPVGNQKTNYFRIKKIFDIYQKLLDKQVVKLVVFSFEKHYSILLNLAKNKGIQTILAEEGTGSYRYLIKSEEDNIEKKSLWQHITYIYKKFWKNTPFDYIFTYPIIWLITNKYSPINFLFKLVYNFFLSIGKMWYYIFNLEEIHKPFIEKNKKYNSFFTPHKNFDELRLDYPDLLTQYFKADNIVLQPFEISSEKKEIIQPLVEKRGYTANTVFYASQIIWGINFSQTLPIVLQILRRYLEDNPDIEKIVFKPHPKEDLNFLRKHLNNIENTPFIIEDDFPYPMEDLIYFVQPKTVISIGSSTLVYAHSSSINTQYISIAPDVDALIHLNKLQNNRTRKFFGEIVPMMKLFPHIDFSLYFVDETKISSY